MTDKKKAGPQIAIIGGGSMFVAGILNTLVNHADEMAGTTVVLQDIDPQRMELICTLGKNLTRAAGADLTITSTLDLDKSLQGADFVLTCFRVGGFDALKLDEEIPLKHGFFGEETAGPGGIFFALRTIPVVVDIAKRMERICPDAFLINYANPTNYLADAVRRTTSIEEYSLCDGYKGAAGTVARVLGVPMEDVTTVTAGVNHFTWLLKCHVNGRDVYPELLHRVAELDRTGMDYYEACLFKLIDTYGCVPTPPSHMVEYFFHDQSLARLREGLGPSVHASFAAQDPLWEHLQEVASAEQPEFDLSLKHMEHYVSSVSDFAISVIIAIATDSREVFTLNLPNRGQIANLPLGDIVEGPAYVSASGADPITVGDLPDAVLAQTLALCICRRLTVDAALTGDRMKLFQAIMANPLVDSIQRAEPMMDEMLAAQARWLPQFSE